MFCGKSMAIALLLAEKCGCLKIWFGKPAHCKISVFLISLLHQVIVLDFSRLTNVIIDFIHFCDSKCVLFSKYHVLGTATQAII